MAITDKEFDENYLGKTIGGHRDKNNKWINLFTYSEADREYLTCTNKTKDKNGKPITLDVLREDVRRIKELIKQPESFFMKVTDEEIPSKVVEQKEMVI